MPYRLMTVTGELIADPPILALPHEHVHVGLPAAKYSAPRRDLTLDQQRDEVVAFLRPILDQGVGLLVDCTGNGVGRDPLLLRAVSEGLGIPIVASTGLWKERGHPDWVRDLDVDALAELFVGELTTGMAGTDIRAGLIKVASNDPMTAEEEKAFRAAAIAHRAIGATITTHTEAGRIGLRQLDILIGAGVPANRIIIGHLDTSTDREYHAAIAAAGAYVEFDRIGAPIGPSDDDRADLVLAMVESGRADQLLLSHDAHALQLLVNATEVPRPMTTLVDSFLLMLRARGIDDATIETITSVNPFRAIGQMTNEG